MMICCLLSVPSDDEWLVEKEDENQEGRNILRIDDDLDVDLFRENKEVEVHRVKIRRKQGNKGKSSTKSKAKGGGAFHYLP